MTKARSAKKKVTDMIWEKDETDSWGRREQTKITSTSPLEKRGGGINMDW